MRASIIVAGLSIAAATWALVAQNVLHFSYVYFRTDTHAAGLLAGSALAMFLSTSSGIPNLSRRMRMVLRACGLAAVAGILGLTVGGRYDTNFQELEITAA